MTQITVYHLTLGGLRKGFDDVGRQQGRIATATKLRDAMRDNRYRRVGTILADSLNDAFRITNSIEDSWTKNPEVLGVAPGGHRSTSVGDVFVMNGIPHVVSSMGFTELPAFIGAPLERVADGAYGDDSF